MRRLRVLVLPAMLHALGCGGSPARPTPPPAPSPPAPPRWSLSGTVVDTLTGSPVSGATVTFSGRPAISAANDGRWELSDTGTTSPRLRVIVEAPGYVTRDTAVGWEAAGRQDILLDIIPDRAPFKLSFFREIVRNGFESPDPLEPLRRWTTTPNFYVNARNPKNGAPLAPSEVDLIRQVFRDTVPQLTGGRFSAGTIEIGFEPRDPRADYINVTFVYEPEGDFCGRARVGGNPGEMTINYERCPEGCGNFSPDTLAHEAGHVMGYWHTQDPGIMNRFGGARCQNTQFSADERLHARVAYSRPPGNRDGDVDPLSHAAIQTDGGPVVVCRLTR